MCASEAVSVYTLLGRQLHAARESACESSIPKPAALSHLHREGTHAHDIFTYMHVCARRPWAKKFEVVALLSALKLACTAHQRFVLIRLDGRGVWSCGDVWWGCVPGC